MGRQEEGAVALKEQLLLQQQEVERAKAQLNQQRSALEAAQAQASLACGSVCLGHPCPSVRQMGAANPCTRSAMSAPRRCNVTRHLWPRSAPF